MAREPITQEEWQTAVDAAYTVLAIEAAVVYGLVSYNGPKIDVGRCEDLLERGRALGYEPAVNSIETMLGKS